MATLLPFKALRPFPQFANGVATKPYDVVNAQEIRQEAQKNPLTFFKVTRSELDFSLDENPYSQKIYQKAKDNLQAFINNGILFQDPDPCFYIYAQTMNHRTQTGIVALSSVLEYNQGIIKKHELTRPDKEQDRINHIATTNAQTGNVFLTYKNVHNIDSLIADYKKNNLPIYNLTTPDDNVQHLIWQINNPTIISQIQTLFLQHVPCTYIADGHHRAASASKVRDMNPIPTADYFLTTLFPANQLQIMDYNRVVKDLNHHSPQQFLDLLTQKFDIQQTPHVPSLNNNKSFAMYLAGNWFHLTAHNNLYHDLSVIDRLNVSILQNHVLSPLLDIDNPRTNTRIDFVGGIRGHQELEKKVNSGQFALAFMIYPISLDELFEVADNNQIMPPKSTWFEPKLRDGLLTHLIA